MQSPSEADKWLTQAGLVPVLLNATSYQPSIQNQKPLLASYCVCNWPPDQIFGPVQNLKSSLALTKEKNKVVSPYSWIIL